MVSEQIHREYTEAEKQHKLNKEYSSDTSHQDGDLPYRMQITYENGGPSYHHNSYFPHFHYQTGYTLAHENYDLLTEYWGNIDTVRLSELEADSKAIQRLTEDGAADKLSEII